ncbi:uncharacterized protein LOC115777425 [Archocentrus centrarchus]|uniref:uncharacterized protein LOC115777425 n=1 Tax=Archocentrus centrarchus TaxID=63155 RepID=UPI0011E9FC7B|nr:uncharacterized protein LOC115777425 [Archocentrus centrarchus]
MIRWNKPDLQSEDYVFYFKDGHVQEELQHELFKGQKPELLSSLTLKVENPDNKQETVKRGEDATLQCSGTRRAAVVILRWRKNDQQPELQDTNKEEFYVFYIKRNRTYENFQLPSFKGRVQLRDPQMKDGDLSVIIKNVSMNDAGIYECYAGYDKDDPQLMSSTNLTVEESGQPGGQSGDGGKKSDSVALIVGLSVPAVLFIGLVGFLIYKKCLNQSNPDYQSPPAQGIGLREVSS